MSPRRKDRLARRHQAELDDAQRWDLLLARGWYRGAPFPDAMARKLAWRAHRDRMLEDLGGSGNRPGAWWQFDSPGQPLRLEGGVEEDELCALVRLGEATVEEVGMLRADTHVWYGDAARRGELFATQPHHRVRYKHAVKVLTEHDARRKQS